MSEMPRTDCAETPISDLCEGALRHYEKLAEKAYEWNNQIPQAIRFWYLRKPELERELSAALKAKEIADHKIAALVYIVERFENENEALLKAKEETERAAMRWEQWKKDNEHRGTPPGLYVESEEKRIDAAIDEAEKP